jgi:hypothetical protein
MRRSARGLGAGTPRAAGDLSSTAREILKSRMVSHARDMADLMSAI